MIFLQHQTIDGPRERNRMSLMSSGVTSVLVHDRQITDVQFDQSKLGSNWSTRFFVFSVGFL